MIKWQLEEVQGNQKKEEKKSESSGSDAKKSTADSGSKTDTKTEGAGKADDASKEKNTRCFDLDVLKRFCSEDKIV